jgi:diaminohydroxyphosphoribosylaminopyrimidine deaminase/5-amino-6-(5-phosphoribosylamino)uracil reductase
MRTAVMDNPQLNIRLPTHVSSHLASYPHPWRLVFGTKIQEEHFNLNIFSDDFSSQTILVTTEESFATEALQKKGIRVFVFKKECPLREKLEKIYAETEISAILLEGGAGLFTSFWEEKIIDKYSRFFAPKILGPGLSPLQAPHLLKMNESYVLKDSTLTMIGTNELLWEGY